MATRRMVSSDIWEDDFIISISIFQRLVWIGLITVCADDQGRLQDIPALIRSKIFPVDDISIRDIEDALLEFVKHGRIVRYVAGNKELIQIMNWWKHQTPRWAGRSNFPPPDNWTDKERYHTAGNKIITTNWDSIGGYTDDYIATKTDCNTINDVKCDVKGDGDVNYEDEGDVDMCSHSPFQNQTEEEFYEQAALVRKKEPFGQLFDAFLEYSGIPETMVTGKSLDPIREWVTWGVTPTAVKEAIEQLREKSYDIVRPASISNALKIVMTQRETDRKKIPISFDN